jgi:hypothetical protein
VSTLVSPLVSKVLNKDKQIQKTPILSFLNFFLAIGLVGLLGSLGGCASLQSVSLTQVPPDRSREIKAEATSWGVFGIFFSNSFADEAVTQLQDQCRGGKVSGVYTKYQKRFWFLVVTRTVSATAFCQKNSGTEKI